MLLEDYPAAYAADVSRRHRWMRGDWQIAPWLRRRVPGPDARRVPNPLSRLSRWKILDNLRRSLVPDRAAGPAARSAGRCPAPRCSRRWSVAALLVAARAARRRGVDSRAARRAAARVATLREIAAQLRARQLAREAFALAVPARTRRLVCARRRSRARCGGVLFTRRRLLEWRTAATAQRSAAPTWPGRYGAMWGAPDRGGRGAGRWLARARRGSCRGRAGRSLLVGCWPRALAWWVSRPLVAPRARASRRGPRLFLRTRRPAHLALLRDVRRAATTTSCRPTTSRRIRPQGVGPSHLADQHRPVAPRQPGGLRPRLPQRRRAPRAHDARRSTSMDRLERYRGHFYNWYDTRTLEPLRPRYVSTVDSGNLAGHLLDAGRRARRARGAARSSTRRCSPACATRSRGHVDDALADLARPRGAAPTGADARVPQLA